MAECKLWVQGTGWRATLRADRIVALRVTVQASTTDAYGPFYLEAVTPDAVGETGGTVVRLCSGKTEAFAEEAAYQLAELIARYIDTPDGGHICCMDEEHAAEAGAGLFNFQSFSEPIHRSSSPRVHSPAASGSCAASRFSRATM